MKYSILLLFSPGSCLCSCASNQARRKLFSPCHGHVFLFFHLGRQTMKGPGGKGEGKPGRGKGKGKGKGKDKDKGKDKGKGTSKYLFPGPGRKLVSVKWSIIN